MKKKRVVTFRQLKPGMMIADRNGNLDELVTRIEKSPTRFWGKKKAITFFDIPDSYYGQSSRSVEHQKTFLIVYEKGTKKYKEVIRKLISGRCKAISDAERDVDLLRAYLDNK